MVGSRRSCQSGYTAKRCVMLEMANDVVSNAAAMTLTKRRTNVSSSIQALSLGSLHSRVKRSFRSGPRRRSPTRERSDSTRSP
jgi:hypothetical protein